MLKQQMLEILHQLRQKLDSGELEKGQQQRMQALADEIERQVSRPEVDMDGMGFLIESIKENIEEFEAQHPELTEMLGRISDLLARMGL